MVKTRDLNLGYPHLLRAKKDFVMTDFNRKDCDLLAGETKVCLIQKMTDGRFAVMGQLGNDHFYTLIKSEKQLHESFDEVEL